MHSSLNEQQPTLIYGLPRTFNNSNDTTGPIKCLPVRSKATMERNNLVNSADRILHRGKEDTGSPVLSAYEDKREHDSGFIGDSNSQIKLDAQNPTLFYPANELTDIPLNCEKDEDGVDDVAYKLSLMSPNCTAKVCDGISVKTNYKLHKKLDRTPNFVLHSHESKTSDLIEMPVVEDGLSSNSEFSSPSPPHQKSRTARAPRSISYSPDSYLDVNLESSSSYPSPTGEALINPSLMRDISNEIRDIKRTLDSSERACVQKTSKPKLVLNNATVNAGDLNDALSMRSTDSTFGSSDRTEVRCDTNLQLEENESRSKILVHARIENVGDDDCDIPNNIPSDSGIELTCLSKEHCSFSNRSNQWFTGAGKGFPCDMNIHRESSHGDIQYTKPDGETRPCLSSHCVKVPAKITGQMSSHSLHSSRHLNSEVHDLEHDSGDDTDQLLASVAYQSNKPVYIPELKDEADRKRKVRDVSVRHPEQPDNLIHGLLFRANYLGSTQILSHTQCTRMSRMIQAQEVVHSIKAPDGETQPSVAVELFVSTDRIMILNTNLEDIIIDHALSTVSYIADIGDLFVLMSRRLSPQEIQSQSSDHYPASDESQISSEFSSGSYDSHNPDRLEQTKFNRKSVKMLCHVLESSDAQLIAQTVGHAFQLAYMDFLRANGVEDLGMISRLDYNNVLKQQEIFCDELSLFCDKEKHKEVIIPKQKGESLGIVIVESGWGSLLPTALLANMHPTGPAARCGQLNIGNQIVAVNDQSLVGLPLQTCQQIIKDYRNATIVKFMVIDCPPVVEVLIRRPNLNYQLGFSVQDGVICSLLRGGIAERGGIRVDHRIIEINGESVVAKSHANIVHLLGTAVGDIHIRTMPNSVFRLLTGQTVPRYI